MIPTYIEIEWKNKDEVEKIVKKLWYKMINTTSINTTKVYAKYGINLNKIKDLRFK